MRVRAREDLPHAGGVILKGTLGTSVKEFTCPTNGKILVVKWEQNNGQPPGASRNAMPGEYELVVSGK